MKYPLHPYLIVGHVLFLIGLLGGCTTVITPLSMQDILSADKNHGLVIANIQLAWHEPGQPENPDQPLGMRWSLTEQSQGTHIALTDLPTTGPFVVRLPAGSYHVLDIQFDGRWGTWHTVLPTSFQVHPGGCTSLGTWVLQRETQPFAEWITGHVLQHLDPTHAELHSLLTTADCSTVIARPGSSLRSRLGFQNRLGGHEF